jgi:hypothetical protein
LFENAATDPVSYDATAFDDLFGPQVLDPVATDPVIAPVDSTVTGSLGGLF